MWSHSSKTSLSIASRDQTRNNTAGRCNCKPGMDESLTTTKRRGQRINKGPTEIANGPRRRRPRYGDSRVAYKQAWLYMRPAGTDTCDAHLAGKH